MANTTKQLIDANVKLVDSNKEFKKENERLKEIINNVINYIYDKSIEYKPNYRKVDLNTKDCVEILDILEENYGFDKWITKPNKAIK